MARTPRLKILMFTPWFPNKFNPTLGNFVVRQAELIASKHDVVLIGITPDPLLETDVLKESGLINGGRSLHFYYKSAGGKQLLSLYKLWKAINLELDSLGFYPQIIHGQILHRSGLFLYALSKRFRVPVVCTEHWSGYTPERNANLSLSDRLNIQFGQRAVQLLLPVTEQLGKSMIQRGIKLPYRVWYNVVDEQFFRRREEKESDFIHISTLAPLKRPRDIITAFVAIAKEFKSAKLSIGGDGPLDHLIEHAQRIGIRNRIEFHGALPYKDVAERMNRSCCLVQFSDYENMPCTISEALTAGILVISSDVGGIKEVIRHGENGYLIPRGDISGLTEAMRKIITHPLQPLPDKRFTKSHLLKEINEIYLEMS
jgi:glycosyltransferase involved in cell wall biosynthesis